MTDSVFGKDFVISGEKTLKEEIEHFSWSPNRDLLAVGNNKAELLLFRLSNLDNIWTIPSPVVDTSITSLCWRSDGTVVAVSYNSLDAGIKFFHMEKGDLVFNITNKKFNLEFPIIYMKWYESQVETVDEVNNIFGSSSFEEYIPDLPVKEDWDEGCNFKAILEMKKFNFLLTLNSDKKIVLYAYGVLPLAKIDCLNGLPSDSIEMFTFLDSCMNPEMNYLTLAYNYKMKNKDINLQVQIYDMKKIFLNTKTWNDVSMKLLRVIETVYHVEYVFEVMKQQCEELVQLMETRLFDCIAENQLSSTIGDELLHFLVWGQPSFQLERLLVDSLKENFLERFKKMLIICNVFFKQTLLANLQNAADTLFYLFNELKGMNKSKLFSDLEIRFDEDGVALLIKLSGELLIKTYELLTVYQEHSNNFQLFIKWLFISVQKLKRPTDLTEKLSAKELEDVADFILESFEAEDESQQSVRRFNLDRVYQYFTSSPLKKDAKIYKNNQWLNLISSSACLKNNPNLIKPNPKRSLAQIVNEIGEATESLILQMTKNVLPQDSILKELNLPHLQSSESDAAYSASQIFLPVTHESHQNWKRILTLIVNKSLSSSKLTFLDILIPPQLGHNNQM